MNQPAPMIEPAIQASAHFGASPHCLLTQAQAAELDRLTIAFGTDPFTLMERAGQAVTAVIVERYQPVPCLILCGPGNNGGDGFVVAEYLRRADWDVVCVTEPVERTGAALQAQQFFQGIVTGWDAGLLEPAGLIVDALFGIGLDRPLTPPYSTIVNAVNQSGVPVVAVDLPSGIHGDSGAVMGTAIKAALTVTFTRKKPGLLLLPGRESAGEIVTATIGMDEDALRSLAPLYAENRPALWQSLLPRFAAGQHKYHHGHALILGGGVMTGAARLAARSAQRTGAGLVTIAAPSYATLIYASNLDSVLVNGLAHEDDWSQVINDPRKTALLLGPGAGISETLQQMVLMALATGKPMVLDADALTCFVEAPERLFKAVRSNTVLTPHSGEFMRLFGPQQELSDKIGVVTRMARMLQCVILLKGADTVIAAPDGRAVVNANAPAWLATAGSGDVLAGIITGFLAQGVEPFMATCIAAWLHGAAARQFSPGMIAEDLIASLPAALAGCTDRA